MPFCVGLTGGIGCGKSRAADLFAALGVEVVDTDEISRELTRPGGAAIEPLRQHFGDHFVASDGALDRSRMRKLVFEDDGARKALEAVLHPLIREIARARVQSARTDYSMLVVPLLIETGAYADLIDRVLVVDCDESRQVERTMARSNLSSDEVRRIIAAQATRAVRLEHADDVLDNDDGMEMLESRVRDLHRRYLALAKAAGTGGAKEQ
jgi:dephospho-CoA kinase